MKIINRSIVNDMSGW